MCGKRKGPSGFKINPAGSSDFFRKTAEAAAVILIFCLLISACVSPNKEDQAGFSLTNTAEIRPSPTISAEEIKRPDSGATWQIDLSSEIIDTSYAVQVYDLDLFDTPENILWELKEKDVFLVCYISVGSWENWRSDRDLFPEEIIGKNYTGWPGEKWLDIRRLDLLGPILQARFDLCKEKGFDGIDPDNVDAYQNKTGFPLTAADQLAFNRWLAEEAHARGLAIGLKNDPEQAAELEPYFDWALTEECFQQGWCEELLPFARSEKAVFAIEYTDDQVKLENYCALAVELDISLLLKNRSLDSWMEACP